MLWWREGVTKLKGEVRLEAGKDGRFWTHPRVRCQRSIGEGGVSLIEVENDVTKWSVTGGKNVRVLKWQNVSLKSVYGFKCVKSRERRCKRREWKNCAKKEESGGVKE